MRTRSKAFGVICSLLMSTSLYAQATTDPKAGNDTPAYQPKRELDAEGRCVGPLNAGWWNESVFYQVFVRSFKDSSKGKLADDGIGDFQGLIDKLNYLNDGDPKTTSDLGITALWLMPINPSPSYHGYDVTDYFGVNSEYGTLDDFKRLVNECHKRGIKVIIDLVLNHSSDEHPWFQEAKNPASPKHDWYIFSEKNPGFQGPWKQTVWHKTMYSEPADAPARDEFYYGLFSRKMPDLNYKNEALSKQMLDVVSYWLKPQDRGGLGIDGYRLDAIRHLVENGPVQENTPETHEWLKKFFAHYKSVSARAFTIGEVWAPSVFAAAYVGDQLDATFEFDLSSAMIEAARSGKAQRLIEAQERVLKLYPPGQYGRFLSNHDQTRVMTQLKSDDASARVAAMLLLSGPGVPFIYYGEELGIAGDKPDPELRTPMQWTPRRNAGFTSGKPWKEPRAGFQKLNVETQSRDSKSLLSLYRELIHVRSGSSALKYGAHRHVPCDSPSVYAFLRTVPQTPTKRGQTVLVVINLSDKPVERYALKLSDPGVTSDLGGVEHVRAPTARLLFGDAQPLNAPAMITRPAEPNAFTDYSPVRVLAPKSGVIIEMGAE
jgi:glycosidase